LKVAALSPIGDLQKLSVKLQEIFFGPEGLFVVAEPKPPLIERLKEASLPPVAPAAASPSASGNVDPVDRGYIGRLR